MDVREKLVEFQSIITCPNAICNFCEHFKNKDACEKHKKEVIADNMIANGVTAQEWISLSEQKPNRDDLVIVFFEGMRDTPAAIQIMYGWCIGGSASHWMPLPQPPK